MDGCTVAFPRLHQKRGFAKPSGQAKPLNMFENGCRLFYNYLSARPDGIRPPAVRPTSRPLKS